jgi:citrate lyase subunit beta/citryl-CoA lyase
MHDRRCDEDCMSFRSLLFVPGDRPERFAKAAASGADALILDLEDSVAAAGKQAARDAVVAYLAGEREGPALYVRVNPADSEYHADDLAALAGASPDGIVLPKVEAAAGVERLVAGLPGVPVLPIATETPHAVFALGGYGAVARHLAGLTWGAEDLPAAIGATAARLADGNYTPPLEIVRALALFGAHAAGVPAIETVFPAFRDLDGLAAYAARGRRDGFSGMMAIHPAQVPVINAAFAPDEAEVAMARRIVAAFAAAPGAGALQLDGRMIDAPHLKQARALLARAG